MARAPVDQIALNGQLRPVASPVDTFVQTSQSPLRGLAEGLAKLGGPLQDMLDDKAKREAEDDDILAKAHAHDEHADEMAEAIRTDRIPPQYSPRYLRTFKAEQGDIAGGKMVAKFSSAWTSWDRRDDATDEEYDQFLADFLKTEVATKDPDVLRGLLPQLNVLENNARQMWVAHKAKVTSEGFVTTAVAGAMQDIDRFKQDALLNKDGTTDTKALWETIALRRAKMVAVGGDVAKFDKDYVEGLSAKVVEAEDSSLLALFDETIPGTKRKYSDVPDFLKVKLATADNLTAAAHKKLMTDAATLKAERETKKNTAIIGIVDFLRTAKPTDVVPEELIKQAENNGEETIRTKLKTWRDDLTPSRKTDPEVVADIQARMQQNPSRAEKIYSDAINKRVFAGDPEAMRAVGGFKDSLKENADVIEKAQNSPTANRLLDSIAKRGSERNEETGDLITGLSQQALQAQQDLRDQITGFVLANPEAKQYEIDKFINQTGAGILGNFEKDPDSIDGGFDYKRDDSLGPALNETADADGVDEPTSGPVERKTDKAGQETYESQTPETKKMVDDLAKANKVTPQEMWKTILKAPTSGVKKMSYDPSQDLGEGDRRTNGLTFEKANAVIEEALLRAGPDAAGNTSNLRQLIVQSESNGDWNAVFGRPPGTVNLAEMSVDQILREQERMRSNGEESTAVGGGQFLYRTLKSLKDEMGLTGSEKFTKGLQEKMIDTLLVRRGLNEFANGKLSQRQFAKRLSQEWAALPNPSTGRSFYAGDGLNASRTHVRNVYQAMGMPVSLGSEDGFDQPYEGGVNFNHPEQEAGVKEQLKSAVAATWQELGLGEAEATSGYRDPNHPVERGKKSGGGEHTKGNAIDVNLRGKTDQQRAQIVKSLMAKGIKRFITYSNSPDMMHIDTKDQTGNGQPYFMHDKSAKNLAKAPQWFKALALGTTDV